MIKASRFVFFGEISIIGIAHIDDCRIPGDDEVLHKQMEESVRARAFDFFHHTAGSGLCPQIIGAAAAGRTEGQRTGRLNTVPSSNLRVITEIHGKESVGVIRAERFDLQGIGDHNTRFKLAVRLFLVSEFRFFQIFTGNGYG